MEHLEEIFAQFNKKVEEESLIRDEIKKHVKEIELGARAAQAALQHLHTDVTKVSEICSKARGIIATIGPHFAAIAQVVPPGEYYKYHDSWKFVVSQLVTILSLITWLETGGLITLKQVEEALNMPGRTEANNSLGLELEDYLLGLCNLPAELARLSVNSVTAGQFDVPFKISKFVNELTAGFRLLNLKNDNLRKRFDAIKYDRKKIEEVVYDISIRGLKPAESGN